MSSKRNRTLPQKTSNPASRHRGYFESHKLPLNNFLIFYVYVIFLFIIANIVKVSAANYVVFFLLGLPAIGLLFIRATYKISVRNNRLETSIKIFIKIVFQSLDINEIESLEELKKDDINSPAKIIKLKPLSLVYLNMPKAIKVQTPGKKTYLISTANPEQLINFIKSIR